MDRFETTVRQYRQCVRAGLCAAPDREVTVPGLSPEDRALWSRSCNWERKGRDEHPVNCLDWDRASTYCAFRGGRLPSATEWAWAAQGGDEKRSYPWGDRPPRARLLNVCGVECLERLRALGRSWRVMHYGDDGWPETAPVGSFPAGVGRWGIEDLAGNVWEMTSSDDPAHEQGKVICGGGWAQTDPLWVRADTAGWYLSTSRGSAVGFRCVADPVPLPARDASAPPPPRVD